ncbi:hypothetical protein AMELA_G00143350 [Ameiurus melas]|uniref:Uncharacterized protein n=1 Tax=Ameiurus melas TaxID=219545 RepID=A0A7J6AL37_AMEME|nr:hypothetical protein AMELA_G00143350 [Ameiurus melas]
MLAYCSVIHHQVAVTKSLLSGAVVQLNWVWFPEDAAIRGRLTEVPGDHPEQSAGASQIQEVQHSNAKNAVLFEAIALIIHHDSEPTLLVRACNQLGQFLQHRETNLRYLALESMCTRRFRVFPTGCKNPHGTSLCRLQPAMKTPSKVGGYTSGRVKSLIAETSLKRRQVHQPFPEVKGTIQEVPVQTVSCERRCGAAAACCRYLRLSCMRQHPIYWYTLINIRCHSVGGDARLSPSENPSILAKLKKKKGSGTVRGGPRSRKERSASVSGNSTEHATANDELKPSPSPFACEALAKATPPINRPRPVPISSTLNAPLSLLSLQACARRTSAATFYQVNASPPSDLLSLGNSTTLNSTSAPVASSTGSLLVDVFSENLPAASFRSSTPIIEENLSRFVCKNNATSCMRTSCCRSPQSLNSDRTWLNVHTKASESCNATEELSFSRSSTPSACPTSEHASAQHKFQVRRQHAEHLGSTSHHLEQVLPAPEMTSQEFFQRWKQLSVTPQQEVQKIFKAKHSMDTEITKAKIIGFGTALLDGVDPNPSNFVGAGVIHTKTIQVGCLLRLEPNTQAQMYRLTLRTSRDTVSQRLCELLSEQF